MKKALYILLMVVILASVCLTGCAPAVEETAAEEAPAEEAVAEEESAEAAPAEEAYDPSDKTLGLVIWNKNHPVVQIMEAGFLWEGEQLGYSAELFAAEQPNLADAIALGETAVANEVDGLCIYLLDEGIKPLIKKATDAGIPVVTAHTAIENPEDWPGVMAWAAPDPSGYAEVVAEAIAEQVGGKGTVAVTQGSFNPLENTVYDTFKAYMEENYPDIKVLDAQEEGFDPAVAASKATAIIQGNPDLVGAFSTTGGGGIAWSQAMEQANNPDLIVVAMDYSEQNLDMIKDGKIFGIVAQPLFDEHAFAAELLDKILRGEDYEYANLLPAPLVTKDNVDDYYAKLDIVKEAFGVE